MNVQIQYRNHNKEIYALLKAEWLPATPEEIVRQEYVCLLLNKYNYALNQMQQWDNGDIDIVIWRNEAAKKTKMPPMIVADCHATHSIKSGDYLQVENYALLAGAKFFVTYYNDGKGRERVFKFSEEKPPLQVVELENLPDAHTLEDDLKTEDLLNKTQKVSKEEFKRVFFACHDAIRNNDKLSPEMAFDEISKVLFIKIRFERDNQRIFDRNTFQSFGKGYQEWFNDIKEKFKTDEIFENRDTLRIKELTFLQILDKLSPYNLAEIPEDIKGVAFEEFLGKTFRGDLGQFFTPRTLVDFMVGVLDPQEGELIADPCCGSGGFLIKTFDYIKKNIQNQVRAQKKQLRMALASGTLTQKKQESLIGKFKELDASLDNSLKDSPLYRLSHHCIYGTDAEPRSARTAKMNMIMQGDGHSGVHHHDGLLNVNGIFDNRFDVILTNPPFGARMSKDLMLRKSDILPSPEKDEFYKNKYKQPYIDAQNLMLERFDRLAQQPKNKQEDGVPLLSFFEMGEHSTLTEVIFMERCLNLLRKGGRMGIVLPEGFLNGSDLQKVRDYVEGRAKILLIVSVPQDVFISAGAMVKSSLVFLKKFTEAEEIEYKNIVQEVTQQVDNQYLTEINHLKSVKEVAQKELKKQLKVLDTKKQHEIKTGIKQRFDYEFPIVRVEKAGINSLGQEAENDLKAVLEEFMEYRSQNQLWNVNF